MTTIFPEIAPYKTARTQLPRKRRISLTVAFLLAHLLSVAVAGCGTSPSKGMVSIGAPVRIEIHQTEGFDGESCAKDVSVRESTLVKKITSTILSTFDSGRVTGSVPFAPSVTMVLIDKDGEVMMIEADYKLRFGRIPKTSITWQLPSAAQNAVSEALQSTPSESVK